MQSNECQVKGVNHFPQSTVCACVCIAEDTAGHLCCQDTLLACAQLAVGPSWAFFAELLPSLSVPSLYHSQGLFLPRGRTWHLCLLNFMRFLSAHSSSLSRSLWMAALPASVSTAPSLGSSADFLRVYAVFSSISLIDKLNKTSAKNEALSYSTRYFLPGGVQPWATTHGARQHSQFFTQVVVHPPKLWHQRCCEREMVLNSLLKLR